MIENKRYELPSIPLVLYGFKFEYMNIGSEEYIFISCNYA